MTPKEVRTKIRSGEIATQTSGMCNGYAQANLCILPKKYAYDFLLFASRNPTSCPILEVLDEGCRYTKYMADHADIATDIPKYRIYRNGELTEEVTDISAYWQDDFVSFLIGCSFSFEGELLDAEVPIRHIEQGRNVPMFLTNIPCEPAGIFHGNMVVSMRPIPYKQVVRAVTATAAMPRYMARRFISEIRHGLELKTSHIRILEIVWRYRTAIYPYSGLAGLHRRLRSWLQNRSLRSHMHPDTCL